MVVKGSFIVNTNYFIINAKCVKCILIIWFMYKMKGLENLKAPVY